VIAQLRTYTINKGMMDGWLKVFHDDIIPRVHEAGMGIHSAWVNDEGMQFIWIRTYDDAEDLVRKEAIMYGSDWWKANVDHIRSHIAHRDIKVIEPILPDGA